MEATQSEFGGFSPKNKKSWWRRVCQLFPLILYIKRVECNAICCLKKNVTEALGAGGGCSVCVGAAANKWDGEIDREAEGQESR